VKERILFINTCVRKDSRTKRLADKLLSTLDDAVEEIRLEDITFPVVDESFLNKRDELIAAGDFSNSLFSNARQFAEADVIVVAAPYWDLSFPASLKQYFELINVVGITFRYTETGIPVGLCKAKKLYYVMTAGGNYVPEEFGFGYVKALATGYYGIEDVELIKAVGLDIDGADVEGIMEECLSTIN
jgi:FMN-dependent NADH-azoreductase